MTENGIRLIYDVEFMEKASKDQIDLVLSHELMHVLNFHFIRADEMMADFGMGKQEFYSQFAPMADLPVNHSLINLPAFEWLKKGGLTYEKASPISYESHPTYESIVKWMLANPKQAQTMKNNLGIGGSGVVVVEINEKGEVKPISGDPNQKGAKVVVIPEVTREGKREYTKDLAELVKSSQRMAGNAPYELQRAIQNFIDEYNDNVLRGWALLESLLVGERSINKGSIRAYSRMNRRTRMIPGRKKIKGFSAMMVVDESGSMSDEEVNLAFALAKKVVLRENNDKLYLVHWDTSPTGEVEEIKYESDVDELKRQRCGGTDFSEFFTHEVFHRHDYDLYICVTDGYPCGWPDEEAEKPVVWIITQEGGYDAWASQYGKGLAVCVEEGN